MQPKAPGNKNSDRPKAQSWRQMSMLGVIPTISPQCFGSETENVRPKGEKNIKRQDDPIKFPLSPSNSYRELCHDSFQYSTNKSVRTANNVPPSMGSYCKFSISLRVLMGYACYYFGTKFEHGLKN